MFTRQHLEFNPFATADTYMRQYFHSLQCERVNKYLIYNLILSNSCSLENNTV